MRTKSLLLIISLSLLPLVAISQVIVDFTVKPEDSRAVLSWKSGNEADADHFNVQRSFDNVSFRDITTIQTEGKGSQYKYVDDDLFKSQMNIYYYRIAIVRLNGQKVYSEVKSVTMNSSGIQRTWGSIKAMFR